MSLWSFEGARVIAAPLTVRRSYRRGNTSSHSEQRSQACQGRWYSEGNLPGEQVAADVFRRKARREAGLSHGSGLPVRREDGHAVLRSRRFAAQLLAPPRVEFAPPAHAL